MKFSAKTLATLGIFSALIMTATSASALSDDEVKSLMKKNNCFKCHAENKAKDGPSYKEIAEKNRDKPDIAAKFYKRVTSFEQVEIKGKKEDHEPLKTKDDAEIKAIVQWILTR
ncbi:class I cytochrome c [Dechloromonas sp. HYN0024]|nr:class I cytochrome c [Dechloromonas sp. HYN0024]